MIEAVHPQAAAMNQLALLVLSGAATLLCACASGPTYGPSDDKALEPVRKAHEKCLENQIKALINGSDDVNFLTRHIVSQCDPTLKPAADYLAKRGFSTYYISRFIEEKRQIGMEATANVILRIKAMQNDPSGGGAGPYM
jgi:uncharacterized membrane protein